MSMKSLVAEKTAQTNTVDYTVLEDNGFSSAIGFKKAEHDGLSYLCWLYETGHDWKHFIQLCLENEVIGQAQAWKFEIFDNEQQAEIVSRANFSKSPKYLTNFEKKNRYLCAVISFMEDELQQEIVDKLKAWYKQAREKASQESASYDKKIADLLKAKKAG